ncbi:hypothetical protein Droror1_Dr00017323 [Drosera rotundifolia]
MIEYAKARSKHQIRSKSSWTDFRSEPNSSRNQKRARSVHLASIRNAQNLFYSTSFNRPEDPPEIAFVAGRRIENQRVDGDQRQQRRVGFLRDNFLSALRS